jgi:hypothetical protein
MTLHHARVEPGQHWIEICGVREYLGPVPAGTVLRHQRVLHHARVLLEPANTKSLMSVSSLPQC